MVQRIFLPCFLIILTFCCKAQNWSITSPVPMFESKISQYFINKDTGWAVGFRNGVAQTTNGGLSWAIKQINWPVLLAWKKVYFVDAQHGWMLAYPGTIARTSDAGKTWSLQSINFEPNAVYFRDKDTGWVVGINGNISRTFDGGASWSTTIPFGNINLGDIQFATHDTGYIVGVGPVMLRTVDGGNSWTSVTFSPVTTMLTDIDFLNQDTGWAAGHQYVFVTYDRGMNWTLKGTVPPYYINKIAFMNKDTGFLTANSNYQYTSTDGGATWTKVNTFIQSSESALELSKINSRTAVVMNDTKLIRTENGGATWDTIFKRQTPFTGNMDKGHFIHAKTGWVIGLAGRIYKTTDSAVTWTAQPYVRTKDYYCVRALNADTLMVGGNRILLRSYNGGATWDSIYGGTAIIRDIYYLNKDTVFFVATNQVYKSTNGGITWVATPSNISSVLYSICFTSKDTGFVCGSSGRIARTYNGGTTWTQVTVSVSSSADLMAIRFNGKVGITVGSGNGEYALTTNGGVSWGNKAAEPSVDGVVLSPKNIILSPAQQCLRRSTDTTASWQSLSNPVLLDGGFKILFWDSNLVYLLNKTTIIKSRFNMYMLPVLDSISRDSFQNTDSLSFFMYGRNFSSGSTPVLSPASSSTAYSTVLSDSMIKVTFKRSTIFPWATYRVWVQNAGSAAGKSGSLSLTVYDTVPSITSSNIIFSNRDSSKFNMNWTSGNGTNRLIIARKNSPVNQLPKASNTYTDGAFGTGTHLGNGNYVVFNGNTNNTQLTQLEPNTTYHFAIIEYIHATAPFSYNTYQYATGSFRTSNVYYNKNSVPLNELTSWNTLPDGSGSSPLNFTDSFTYYLVRRAATIDSSWEVSGRKSYVVFGNDVNALTYTIDTGAVVKLDSIYLKSYVTITSYGDFIFRKSLISTPSLVRYLSPAPQQIPVATYCDLEVSGGAKTINGNTTVSRNFSMNANVINTGYVLGLSSNLATSFSYASGFVTGRLSKVFQPSQPSQPSQELFPVGKGAYYRPVYVRFPNTVGVYLTVTAEFIDSTPTRTGLPVTDATMGTVSLNKPAREGYWRINMTNLRAHTITAAGTKFSGITDSSSLRLIRRLGPTSAWLAQGTAEAVSGTKDTPLVSRIGLNGSYFAEYTIGSDSMLNPLPVKLIRFSATRSPQGINQLVWSTASEQNNLGFTVYRSTDQQTWHKTGFVNGNGTTSGQSFYRFNDAVSGADSYYYFLRQTDRNGQATNSQVVTVHENRDAAGLLSVNPNPATDHLYVIGQPDLYPLEAIFYNTKGSREKAFLIGSEAELGNGFDIKDLPSGLYHIQLIYGQKQSLVRFVKQ